MQHQEVDRVLARRPVGRSRRAPPRWAVALWAWSSGGVALAAAPVCYGPDSGPTTRAQILSQFRCTGDGDPCCLEDRPTDVDADGDGVWERCDPDDEEPDDDHDGLPTREEDLDGNGTPFDDTDSRNPSSEVRPAFLEESSPLDDDGDGHCDCAWIGRATEVPAFCSAGVDDCVDFLGSGHPGAEEVVDPDRWDHDCLGDNDLDLDGDGFQSALTADSGQDCDDRDPDVHPGASEDEGPADADCDGFSDPHRQLRARGGCACDGSSAGGPGLALLLGLSAARRRR